jgi:phage terminase small subunit
VDVASKYLEARIGEQGAAGLFPNNPEGIAALGAFCGAHQVDLAAVEPGRGRPLANDSGQHQGRRAVRAGHAAVREILFIVASLGARPRSCRRIASCTTGC